MFNTFATEITAHIKTIYYSRFSLSRYFQLQRWSESCFSALSLSAPSTLLFSCILQARTETRYGSSRNVVASTKPHKLTWSGVAPRSTRRRPHGEAYPLHFRIGWPVWQLRVEVRQRLNFCVGGCVRAALARLECNKQNLGYVNFWCEKTFFAVYFYYCCVMLSMTVSFCSQFTAKILSGRYWLCILFRLEYWLKVKLREDKHLWVNLFYVFRHIWLLMRTASHNCFQ